jgi:hypothetical protein
MQPIPDIQLWRWEEAPAFLFRYGRDFFLLWGIRVVVPLGSCHPSFSYFEEGRGFLQFIRAKPLMIYESNESSRDPPALGALHNALRERRTASFEAYPRQLDLFRAMAGYEMVRGDFVEVGRLSEKKKETSYVPLDRRSVGCPLGCLCRLWMPLDNCWNRHHSGSIEQP